MSKATKHQTPPLTEVELEIMSYVWDIGECTVHDVLEQLPSSRPLAYNSVSTMIRTLEKKGYVSSRKSGRVHIYSAAVSRPKYAKNKLRSIVSRLFKGSPSELVRTLVSSEDLSDQELNEIDALIKERKK